MEWNLMANPYIYGIPQRHLEHTFGRGSIMHDMVGGLYFIQCSRHPEILQPSVKVDIYKDMLVELEKAFDNCSGCINEARVATRWANTRFPEGAEL